MKSLILVISFCAVLSAQNPQFNNTQYRSAFAKETLTVSTVSLILTVATYNPTCTEGVGQCIAEVARIICKDNGAGGANAQISFWEDGSTPTAAVGNILNPYDVLTIYGTAALQNFKMIRVGANDVICNVVYYRFKSNVP